MPLSAEHLSDLKRSGLSDETIELSGIHSLPPDKIISIIRANGNLRSLMVIPYPGTEFLRYKLFPALKLSSKDTKPRKYYQPPGSPLHVYQPPGFDPEAEVIRITEGEKKALKGSQEGLNVIGLGGIWNFSQKDESDVPQLIDDLNNMEWYGKTVELIPDGDFQLNASVSHAVYRLGVMLQAAGASVRVVRLPGNSKLDDYLCTHSVEAFCQLELLSLDDRIFRGAQIKEQGLGLAIRRSVLSTNDFLDLQIERRPYILNPLIRPGTLGMIYSPAGFGKTHLALALGISVTYRVPFGDMQPEHPVKTLYIDAEMPSDDLQKRIRDLTYGLGPPEQGFHIWSAEYAERQGWPRPLLTDKDFRTAIYDFVSAENYGLLILDNKAALTPGIDESAKMDWDAINQWLLSLRFLGVAAVMVHHAGKSGQQRGTSGVEDSLDFIVKLERPRDYNEEDGCNVDLVFQKARSMFGADAASLNFRIQQSGSGDGLIWVVKQKEASKQSVVITLLGSGESVSGVARDVGINKSTVSRIRAKAIRDGYLEEDPKKKQRALFTMAGKREFGGSENEEF